MAEIGQKTDFTLKFIIVGNAVVRKSNNSYRFSKGLFAEEYKATVGMDFAFKNIVNQTIVKIQIFIYFQIKPNIKILRPGIKILEFKYGILLGKKTSNNYLEVIRKVVYVTLLHMM